MDEEDSPSPTPVTLPGKPRLIRQSSVPGNGVPDHVDFEDTGEIVKAVMAAGADGLMEAFAKKAAEHFNGQDGGGGDSKREAKKRNVTFFLVMLLIGPGGAVAAHYALKSQAATNTQNIDTIQKASKELEPRIKKTEDDVRFIKVRVGEVSADVTTMKGQQTKIVDGIESLKKENVDQLKKDLDRAERELRRRRLRDDD